MASIHSLIHDCGPEFVRRVEHEIRDHTRLIAKRFHDIARSSSSCREAGERAQAEADRLLTLSDEEAGHAVDH